MGMSNLEASADRSESLATIYMAVELGLTLLDTSNFDGYGHNELLIREILCHHRREDIFIALKFSALRAPAGYFVDFNARPEAIKKLQLFNQ